MQARNQLENLQLAVQRELALGRLQMARKQGLGEIMWCVEKMLTGGRAKNLSVSYL
jgi:hypothetical protein